MIIRNYEKQSFVMFLIFILFITELLFVIYILNHKEYDYLKINGIVIKNDVVLIMIDEKTRKTLRKNSSLYYNDKKYVFKIIEDTGKVLKEGYYELILKFSFSKDNNKIKPNDILELVLTKKKISLISFFKLIWEGD